MRAGISFFGDRAESLELKLTPLTNIFLIFLRPRPDLQRNVKAIHGEKSMGGLPVLFPGKHLKRWVCVSW